MRQLASLVDHYFQHNSFPNNNGDEDVPSPSVNVTFVGFGLGWKSSGVPNRVSDEACSDQP